MGKEKVSILVVRDFGKAKGYRISLGSFKRIVVLAVVFFILTVASLFGFFHLFWERKSMQDGIRNLTRQVELAKSQIKKHEAALKETKKQLASLRARSKEGSQKKSEPRASSTVDKEAIKELDVITPPEPEIVNQVLDIRNFKEIDDREGLRLKVEFGLFNQDPQNRVVEGRIIMVATKDQPGSPLHVSYPWVPLSSGRPVETRLGYRFAIRRFKQIEGYFERPSWDLRFDKVTIFVHSIDGKLLLEKVYFIEER